MNRQRLLVIVGLVVAIAGVFGAVSAGFAAPLPPRESGIPDYFNTANWANSPIPLPTGPIAGITVEYGGSGYTAGPTVTITDPQGTGATATAVVAGGVITGFIVGNTGSGYVNPKVVITDATGSGARAAATISPIGPTTAGMRKFVDTLPRFNTANNLGQMVPVAVPDTVTYPGSDYYEIEAGEYSEKMHSDLPPTRLRGYRQTNRPGGPLSFHHLGPVIVATKDRPVRIKFTNNLPTGAGGDLFIPVDTSIMGSGEFDIDYDPETKAPIPPTWGVFTQNRATLHLHGGRTPWISDGTAHQWITPQGESTDYPKGVSVAYVPDMWFDSTTGNTILSCAGQLTCAQPNASNNPGPGSQTYFWTNEQSARLMFYHEHSWGITRLGVYVGLAAGYVVRDDVEQDLIDSGLIPGPADEVPLILEDKTFVDVNTILDTDPTWNWGSSPGTLSPWSPGTPVTGDLWWPHVYVPAQNPFADDMSGINPFGRWHYGPWFWPPTNIPFGPVANEYYDPACNPTVNPLCANQPPERPGTPHPSWGAEAFMDTPVVNGTAYPTLTVEPKAYRFRILNASHDRFYNLQLYKAANKNGPTTPGAGLPIFTGTPDELTEVAMVAASPTASFPPGWPTDGREGGVPDPTTAGPSFIQIGSEGGFLPQPVVLPMQPIAWNLDPTTFTAGLVLQQNEGGGTLMLGPAERADVIIDFSAFAGNTLILYNDAPAPWPALDPHYDYYTGDPDNTDMGGAPTTLPGYGPNTRTIMQIQVSSGAGTTFNLTALQNAFVPPGGTPGVFEQAQEEIIVGQTAYNDAYNTVFPARWPYWGVSRITDTSLSFQKVDGTLVDKFPMKPKAIQDEMGETFDEFGRMSAKLGLELAFTNAGIQTFVLQNFVDPPTEIIRDRETQIWKITHNGVDTHPVHFHLFEVQVLNRVGWDGFIYLPDPNELGWKDTVRISPLEDTIVALRPVHITMPFSIPNSVRPLNPAYPLGSQVGFSQLDPVTGQQMIPPVENVMYNLGMEYLWHCHILSHEESDMMRPVVVVRTWADVDFDDDFKTDIAVFRPSQAKWYIIPSSTGIAYTTNWGLSTDKTVPGDYDGDFKTDVAVYRPSNGTWYIIPSSTGIAYTVKFGAANDIPVQGDYDGDGKTDIALWRPSDGRWYVIPSLTGVAYSKKFGVSTDKVVPGDYDGDYKMDLAVWRPSDGRWYITPSSTGKAYSVKYGTTGDIPVPGNYDGDFETDIAVFSPSIGRWFIVPSSGTEYAVNWGISTDTPVQADFDGDFKTDIAVWRASNGTWYIIRSSNNTATATKWGVSSDKAITQ